ncbi:adenosine kinase [Limnohabitans sp. MMS-10A-178]|jgi:sugar/nucleoside kinase (ribokinase family)|uniref:adenosine kinase n=1 Tax=Limnohabitans sp. MMS-10A-178 TaxID=1835767 RepID=UPI001E2E965A|nr:adenosine kinase [Limnohabitans sp. MMS-10A-178]
MNRHLSGLNSGLIELKTQSSMSHYDLYAIGNALVDSEYEVSDAQLKSMGVDKRHMTLIDTPRRAQLLEHVKALTPRQTGGGSAGNTVVALAQLGGKAFYSCKVAHDALGDFYVKDLQARGVDTNLNHTRASEGQTGSCLVLVTPDAERSMCTFLGVSAELDDAALHPKDIEKSKIYYMEGYLAASPTGLAAALKGRQIAREAGVALALTLSDVSMIQFCKAGLDAMLGDGVDYLFCNQEEAQVWCGSQDLNVVKETLKKLAKMVCLTRGPDGSEIITAQNSWHVPAEKVQAIDTNGAGDMFAGAFLYAITRGYSPDQAANLGNHAAAAVVSQHGNRLTLGQLSTIKAYALPAHK